MFKLTKLTPFYAAIFGLLIPIVAHAQNADLMQFMKENPNRSGVIMHSYEFHDCTLTPTPKGYTPFYISHYGRHGSRSNWGVEHYLFLQKSLMQADSAGNLSMTGRQLLDITNRVLQEYQGMPGRLTDRGEREHQQLAERMFNRFPEVFTKTNGRVQAISSKVERCIISMAAFTNQLTRMNKKLQYNFDVGDRFQRYIDCAGKVNETRQRQVLDSLSTYLPSDSVVVYERLFISPQLAHNSLPADRLQKAVFEVAIVAQDFDIECNILDYMAAEEVYRRMVSWSQQLYLTLGNVPGFVEMRRTSVQRGLNDFIEKADAAIREGEYCADLRFGHDYPLLTIISAMEISGAGERLQPDEIETRWWGAKNLCMGSNLQLIFYRPKKMSAKDCADEDILVKVLYNEKERTILGLTPVFGNYFRWSDVKQKWRGDGRVQAESEWKAAI